ncbi:uncharacterized protein LOC128739298 [Sabethes cyaneus]|uniref:uncharacterized protein LOC128739298 n=1 Tax=Sabethes cyaneus TaxID=53552 RepID=UPI00237D9AA9|nr:uncharacterized protein LOC128739298 [Sabethes cyaneus]
MADFAISYGSHMEFKSDRVAEINMAQCFSMWQENMNYGLQLPIMARVTRLAAAIIFHCELEELESLEEKRNQRKLKQKRKIWVREFILKRSERGFMQTLYREIQQEDPRLYRNFVRLSSEDFNYLLQRVAPYIRKQDTILRKSISPEERLCLTLRFLATGDSYKSLMYLFRIPSNTVSTIIPEVCRAIFNVLKDDFMSIPATSAEWEEKAEEFNKLWNCPNCLGALDGKHIVMQAPPKCGSLYYNYKGTNSIVLMALADAAYKFTYIDVGCQGRISDGGVFNRCTLSKALEEKSLNVPKETALPNRNVPVPYVIVADDAFSMKHYLMKPYPFRNLNGTQRVFNYRLSRARRVVENAFGILSARFRVLRKPLALSIENVKFVTLSICALHNFIMCRNESRTLYAPAGTFDTENSDGTINQGSWRNETPEGSMIEMNRIPPSNVPNDAKRIREEFENYFVTDGEVPWQYKFI